MPPESQYQTANSMDILLLAFDAQRVAGIFAFFESRGHSVDAAYDASAGLDFATAHRYDAVLIDRSLPGIDALEGLRRLRRDRVSAPIVILSTSDRLEDKLVAFSRGADDFLVEPYAMLELEARLLALCRRCRGKLGEERLRVADLEFDLATLSASRAGNAIEMPPTPLKILCCLMRESPRVVPRAEIEHQVWGNGCPDSDALRVHMSTLRGAVDRPFDRPLVHTVRGIGYRLIDLDNDR